MLDLLRYIGSTRFALVCVFVLAVAATLAVTVPTWAQTPTLEQEAVAIEEQGAQVEMRGGERAGRAGRAGMFERWAAYFRGGGGAHAGMRGGRPGFAAGAQGRRSGMPGGPMGARGGRTAIAGGRFDLASRALRGAEEIGLSDVQKQGIEEALEAHRRQQIERDASMKLVGLDLAELLKDESSDLAVVEQKMNEVAGLRVEEQMAALRYRRNVRGILSAEQIEQLNDFGDRTPRRRPSEDRAPRARRQR